MGEDCATGRVGKEKVRLARRSNESKEGSIERVEGATWSLSSLTNESFPGEEDARLCNVRMPCIK